MYAYNNRISGERKVGAVEMTLIRVKPTSSTIPWIPSRRKRGEFNRRWGVVMNDKD